MKSQSEPKVEKEKKCLPPKNKTNKNFKRREKRKNKTRKTKKRNHNKK
jgi:hypothetical protein